ncbi:HIT domain-containing protein [Campylobacter sp. RM9344]|uniref:HIT domain-containing protein n=1 Tax=Campylobacter californiensis TaxID=1032243 RepID=A0AAW3ZQY1_9BACT|nr:MULTISPECIES: HIT domain-containing protein [unclassified Campylobacter]MBE2983741.1 HIT domain-containing protein [Campylobacter sp. RM6883]MBE2985695.1 HIT domain-containing protein [Campylobacter sp. RM12919]MBE2988270.1 HIT domain-containing protein [Campylobacter sp. RM12920]MBE2994280.1 HIT domain-containing protein [Campylobacter sp. RM6913]MBE3022705.1 HIT domain-containing protein [Campylobacter sp. 7477a]MBE3028588.1 HIT domain-containing protein [Campylobacter sp. RM9344]
MEHLCAPWRSEYFGSKPDGCVFCNIINHPENDDKAGVLFRAKYCFGIMNLYPYTPGHFMVIPLKHTDKIEDLQDNTWLEMSRFVREGVKILKNELHAEGVNIGMNLGAAAGAGIAEHVHYHLVPRWSRDTNFITTISDVRVNGVPFHPLFEKLKKAFSAII